MTDNHTELCKKLREEIALFKAARIDPGQIVPALAMIESQAARIQQQALEYASLFDQCSQHLARIADLEKALKGLSSMYTFAWDVVDGGLFMSQDGKLRFEDAHKEARRVLGVELMEVDENGELTPEHEERTKLTDRIAELEKERDALKVDAERYEYLLDCEVEAARRYLPSLDADEFKNARRARHSAALQAEKETRS